MQSQRYVRLDDFHYVIPPEIEKDPEAKKIFIDSMNEEAKRYLTLAAQLEKTHFEALTAAGMNEKALMDNQSEGTSERNKGLEEVKELFDDDFSFYDGEIW